MRPLFKYLLAALALVLCVTAGLLIYLGSRLDPMAREYVVRGLEEKFNSDVQLGHLDVSLFPEPSATATAVTLRQRGRPDVPPLIQFDKLVIRAGFEGLIGGTKRIRSLRFEGLKINIPPKDPNDKRPIPKANDSNSDDKDDKKVDFVISRIEADGTVLKIHPKEDWKEPLTWDMKRLTLRSAGVNRAMDFQTTLINAKPPGEIESKGKFGPWIADDPGLTPVSGDYTFENADLSVFKGIAGMLASKGNYRGVLERIEADGNTTTPDFRLTSAGQSVPLTTQFHAIIDGTSGDTLLQPVNAKLGDTAIRCQGGVTSKKGVKGKEIALDVAINGGIQDILRLTVKSQKPAMMGAIQTNAKMNIPPGDRDVIEKLRLAGNFTMANVRFTAPEIQQKIDEMSKRAQGQPEAEADRVASKFGGSFVLANSNIDMPKLTYVMPGALVNLKGSYGIRSEKIDFQGTLRMDARISQTTTGVKSILLKAVDPFFAKDGAGAVIPIKIAGTREKPEYGLNFRGNKDKSKDAPNERARQR